VETAVEPRTEYTMVRRKVPQSCPMSWRGLDNLNWEGGRVGTAGKGWCKAGGCQTAKAEGAGGGYMCGAGAAPRPILWGSSVRLWCKGSVVLWGKMVGCGVVWGSVAVRVWVSTMWEGQHGSSVGPGMVRFNLCGITGKGCPMGRWGRQWEGSGGLAKICARSKRQARAKCGNHQYV